MATAEANIQNKIRKGKKSSEENLEDYLEILEENTDVENETVRAEKIKLSSEDDLESLLKLAEDLKEKIDTISSKIVLYKFLQFILIFSFFLYLFFGFYITSEAINIEKSLAKREAITIQQNMLQDMNRSRENLLYKLEIDGTKRYGEGAVAKALQERLNNIEESIKTTQKDITTLNNTPISNLKFMEFISMPEKILPAIMLLALALFTSSYFISRYKKKIIPEKTSLSEVLQLLREIHFTIAEKEDWSILKRAEFRIRLSRFDLSEKKDSVFSFFS